MDKVEVVILSVMILGAVFFVFVLLPFVFYLVVTAGLYNPIQESEAISQFSLLAGTPNVIIVSHSRYNWDVDFSLMIDDRPAKGYCSREANKQAVCEFTYMEVYLPPEKE